MDSKKFLSSSEVKLGFMFSKKIKTIQSVSTPVSLTFLNFCIFELLGVEFFLPLSLKNDLESNLMESKKELINFIRRFHKNHQVVLASNDIFTDILASNGEKNAMNTVGCQNKKKSEKKMKKCTIILFTRTSFLYSIYFQAILDLYDFNSRT
jgi:hypothetical protein